MGDEGRETSRNDGDTFSFRFSLISRFFLVSFAPLSRCLLASSTTKQITAAAADWLNVGDIIEKKKKRRRRAETEANVIASGEKNAVMRSLGTS